MPCKHWMSHNVTLGFLGPVLMHTSSPQLGQGSLLSGVYSDSPPCLISSITQFAFCSVDIHSLTSSLSFCPAGSLKVNFGSYYPFDVVDTVPVATRGAQS